MNTLTIPFAPPERFAPWSRNWLRESRLLADIAGGTSLHIELLEASARREHISSQAGSLKEAVMRLERADLIQSHVRSLYLGGGGRSRAGVKVLQLTEAGRDFCKDLDWTVQETDFERILRLHQGESQPEHTTAILLFLREARLRGWQAAPCPDDNELDVRFPHGYRPDAEIYDEHAVVVGFVEVERGTGSPSKWKTLSRFNWDFGYGVLLCTMNPQRRDTLTAQIKALGLPGYATDLHSLLRNRDSDLWVDHWE